MQQRSLPRFLQCRYLFLPRHASGVPAGGAFDGGAIYETAICPNDAQMLPLLSSSDGPITPSRLLQLLRSVGDSTTAFHVFEWCRIHGLKPASPSHAPFTFQAIFEIAAREKSYGNLPQLKALLLRAIKQGYTLTQHSAALLIRSFITVRSPSDALLAFRSLDPSLRRTNLRNRVLAALLRSPDREHQAEALALLGDMLNLDSHCVPDTATLSIVLDSIIWSSNRPAINEILRLIIRMIRSGVFPTDAYQFTKAVVALCRSGGMEKAWNLVHAVKECGGTVEVAVWNALLTGLSKNRDTLRMNLVFCMMQADGLVDVVAYGILINHFCKSRNIELALKMFEKMTNPDSGVSPDTLIFNNLIDGLCKKGRTCEAVVLLDRMKTHRCDPNTITFNALIDGFCRAGEIDTAIELNFRMDKEGVSPNVITLHSLISGMCRNGRVSRALSFFHEKKVTWANANGNSVTYCTLIGALLHANNVSKAMELFDEMIEEGHKPNDVVCFTLISGLLMVRRIDDARLVASMMRIDGFQLDTNEAKQVHEEMPE